MNNVKFEISLLSTDDVISTSSCTSTAAHYVKSGVGYYSMTYDETKDLWEIGNKIQGGNELQKLNNANMENVEMGEPYVIGSYDAIELDNIYCADENGDIVKCNHKHIAEFKS